MERGAEYWKKLEMLLWGRNRRMRRDESPNLTRGSGHLVCVF